MKSLFLAIFIFLSIACSAQLDTTKMEQYCQVVATPRLLSSKVTIDIDYGEERSIWKDNRMKDEKGKLKKFNTAVDAINYLGKNGWKLVNVFPVGTTGSQIYYYIFKKEFLKSETE